jgi:exopolyphosphatase
MGSPLTLFLASVRKTALSTHKSPSTRFTLVLGNPSCDLDSFVSSVVFSFFHSQNVRRQNQGVEHVYVPLMNLPTVQSAELWRLRPEFGTALSLAARTTGDAELLSGEERHEAARGLLKNLITIADLTSTSSSPLSATFVKGEGQIGSSSSENEQKQAVVLVDHNAPSVAGLSNDELSSKFNLVGCIDHHADESSIPDYALPRIIQTGIGSCTSLVVKYLCDENIWSAPSQQPESDRPALTEVACLALAPILIDTFNLKASGDKCSDTDRDAVAFLESHLNTSTWDRDTFFNAISNSNSNSLDLLNMPDIFERDFKEWTETSASSGQQLNIGIASLVRSIPWLVKKAGSPEMLANSIHHFSRETDHKLDIVGLITRSSGPNGEFRKELVVVAFGEVAAKALEIFEENMTEDLKLIPWREDEGLLKAMEVKVAGDGAYRIWWQGDTQKSRKQVAPALREAVRV